MACRGFTSPHHPKSVTYVLNLLCIRCPEPAPALLVLVPRKFEVTDADTSLGI